jgi:thiol-disulfide isomerase/thioredoxin
VEVLGKDAFDGTRLERPGIWVVNFSADWCGFCEEFLPKYATLERDRGLGVVIGDLTDLDSPLWDLFRLTVTPTIVAFRDGVQFFRRDGRRGEGLDEEDLRALRAAISALDPGRGPAPGTRP